MFKLRSSFPKKRQLITRFGGFTLIEMIVSLSVFIIALLIATSSFLSVVNADRKSRAVRIANDNLNLALEDMQRRIKTGANYYCGSSTINSSTIDCASASGDTSVSFLEQDGVTRTIYSYDATTKALYRESHGPGTLYVSGEKLRITAPEISIDNVIFNVQGSTPGFSARGGDSLQPYVIIVIRGSTFGVRKVDFSIQTLVTQRNYDS